MSMEKAIAASIWKEEYAQKLEAMDEMKIIKKLNKFVIEGRKISTIHTRMTTNRQIIKQVLKKKGYEVIDVKAEEFRFKRHSL